MPGAVTYGFHEGGRSEYLAQYVFASWGTAVAIPHQEDHGIDLTCTLMDQAGKLYLARSPYTVQIKSKLQPVVFEGKEAVRWVLEHPLPLFLCVVEKSSAHLSVYHTLPRFYTWSLGEWPDRLEMMPEPAEPGRESKGPQWSGKYSFSLGQPILDFDFAQMLDDGFWQKARAVFEHWINIENDNLTRVHARLLKCRMPASYRTNETWVSGWTELRLLFPSEDQFALTKGRLRESLEWIGEQLERKGDHVGAGEAALLHRHLFREADSTELSRIQAKLNAVLGQSGYVYAGVDHLEQMLQSMLGSINVNASLPKAGHR